MLGGAFLGGFGGGIAGDLAYSGITNTKMNWEETIPNAVIAGVFNMVLVGYPHEMPSYKETLGSFKVYFDNILTQWVEGDGKILFSSFLSSICDMGLDGLVGQMTNTQNQNVKKQSSGSNNNGAIIVSGGWVMLDV